MEKKLPIKAFTLIEVLIVLGVVSIVSGLIFASYNYFSSKKQLESEVKKFVSVLELAREKARAEDVSQCINPTESTGIKRYEITIEDETHFSVKAICTDIQGKSLSYELQKSVFVQGVNKTIGFAVNSGTNSTGCFCFLLKAKSADFTSKFICIDDYGNIRLEETDICQ